MADAPGSSRSRDRFAGLTSTASKTVAGVLRRTTTADQGLIAAPAVTPHFEIRAISDRELLLVSESFNTLLRGRIHGDLLPLLDGRRSPRDIAASLAEKYPEFEVRKALVALASRGYVVSGEHTMERSRAAYWSSLGVSPRWAEGRLGGGVVVTGDDGRLVRRLAAMGVAVSSGSPSLSVIVCADYLDERHAAVNQRHLGSGVPWMLVRPRGMQPLFGPVFRPGERGPCWSCLAFRLRGHREVHDFLRNFAGESGAFRPPAAEPGVLESVYGLVAAEIAKWLVLEDRGSIHERAISLDMAGLKSSHHRVTRRPQCFACGDETLYRADRPPAPLVLRPSPKVVHNSGGVRSVSPEETLSRYRHLVSPVAGVVTWLERSTDEADPWLHVNWAGSNLIVGSGELSTLRRSLRSKAAGKGSTPGQSEVSALCEAVERYCCGFSGEEIHVERSFNDFAKAGESAAIDPNDVQLFSDAQLDNAAEINARDHPYNYVSSRLDPDLRIAWSPVWSFTQGRHRYLPTSLLYRMSARHRGRADIKADSNGCAAGNTLEEAILQGFLELVERDAFAIWWYNRILVPEVDLGSFEDDYLNAARDYYAGDGRELWVLDITSDLGIPVFVAVSRRDDNAAEDIIYGVGAHADPHIAALRAVCEMNQFLNWIRGSKHGGSDYDVDDPTCLWWWRNGRIAEQPYLAPASGVRSRGRADYPVPETLDVREDVECCRALVEARGMEFLTLDLTRPDIGMPVARVIVPGLRHFWERFAPGRLFDVPVEMGWRDERAAEADLNPVPVII